jgi:hypothetical protein
MALLLSIYRFSSVAAALTPLLPAFIPGIGLLPLYRMRPIPAALILTAWALALAASLNPSPSFIALPFVLLHSLPTLWQQATGEALIGPLKGTRLRPLGGELTRWSRI